ANGAFKKPSWISLDGFSDLTAGHLRAVEVEGTSLLVANVAGTLLAYLNSCGGCRATLDGGQLSGGILTCPSCRERFDLPRAGRAIGEDQPRLGPIPLLPEAGGRLRVALSVCAVRAVRPPSSPPCASSPWCPGQAGRPARRRTASSAATSAAPPSRPSTGTCSTSRNGASSARARPASSSGPTIRATGRPGAAACA